MYDAFSSSKKELTTEIINNVLSKKTNLLTTMAEQLNFLINWVGWDTERKDGVRARFAHPSEEGNMIRIKDEINDLIKEVEKGNPNSDKF